MNEIFIKQLQFYAFHGVSDEERRIGHRYLINLNLHVNGNASDSDQINETVDYGELCSFVLKEGTENKFRTMERLATHLARLILANYPLVASVTISVEKRLPPAPIIAKSAGVKITLDRK